MSDDRNEYGLILDIEGLQSSLISIYCFECGSGSVSYKENFAKLQDLCTFSSMVSAVSVHNTNTL